MDVIIEGGYMAKSIRPKQLEKKNSYSPFCNEMVNVCSLDFYLLERQTRACSLAVCECERVGCVASDTWRHPWTKHHTGEQSRI